MPLPSPTTTPATVAELNSLDSFVGKLAKSFEQTPWTGWGILAICIVLGVVAGRIAQIALRVIGKRLRDRHLEMRAIIFESAASPASLWLTTLGLNVGLAWVVLPDEPKLFVGRLILLLHTVALTWFIYNLVDLLTLTLRRLARRTHSAIDNQIVPMISRSLRLFIGVVFILFTAQNVFGADITAWLTGLGIVGLAVSLGAQDSIKNLFGSFTIFLDRTFVIGDHISVDGQEGIVEEIGFRSTRLRTFDGHLVTIPNSKIVDGSVMNVSRRGSIRRVVNLPIAYNTPPEKVQQAVAGIKQILKDQEIAGSFDMEKFPPRVAVSDLNAKAMNVVIYYWFQPADQWKFLEHAEKFNLKLKQVLDQAGVTLTP